MSSEVAEEWASITLKEAAGELFTDGDWVESKDQDPDGEVRLIQLADIGDGSFLNKSSRFLTMDKARELRCTLLQPGDLLIARMADPIARCCIFPGLDQAAATVVDVSIVRPGPEVDREYLAYAVSNPVFRSEALGSASGTTRSRISRSNLGAISLPLPPLDEQRRIAEVLRSLDEAIARTKDAVKQASHTIDGMLQRLFVEGIGHAVFKDGHSTPIPASWDERSLGELSATPITYGVVQPGPNVADGIPFVRGGDFPNGKIDIAALRKIGKDVASQYGRTQLRGGEIVVSLVGYPGACAIVPDALAGANIARQAALIRPSKEVDARYLYQFIRSPIGQARLKKETIGSAQQVINLRDLKEVIVAVPPKPEQEQIAAILADLDAFVELETENLDKLTKLKGSIAADLLSGRVWVPA